VPRRSKKRRGETDGYVIIVGKCLPRHRFDRYPGAGIGRYMAAYRGPSRTGWKKKHRSYDDPQLFLDDPDPAMNPHPLFGAHLRRNNQYGYDVTRQSILEDSKVSTQTGIDTPAFEMKSCSFTSDTAWCSSCAVGSVSADTRVWVLFG
jgi:hypothetical protein